MAHFFLNKCNFENLSEIKSTAGAPEWKHFKIALAKFRINHLVTLPSRYCRSAHCFCTFRTANRTSTLKAAALFLKKLFAEDPPN